MEWIIVGINTITITEKSKNREQGTVQSKLRVHSSK